MKPKIEPIFEPSDFVGCVKGTVNECIAAAEIANAKIEKLIESWPVVYGVQAKTTTNSWDNFCTDIPQGVSTHQARLAFIQPIGPCKHEPLVTVKIAGFNTNGCSHFRNEPEIFECKHCKKPIKPAKWEISE